MNDEAGWAESRKAAIEVTLSLCEGDENEAAIRARIAASVNEAIKLIDDPEAFSDEELEADVAAAIEAAEFASGLTDDQ